MRTSRPFSLVLFLAGNVLLSAGLFVHVFLFNFYLRELGLPAWVMGFQAAAITIGGLAALLPAGIAIDRFGVRPVLLAGVGAAAIGLALTAIVRNPASIYAAAALTGVGGACCRVAWGPAIMRLASEAARPRAFTWNVALLIGTGSGWTALAGILPTWSARIANVAGLSGTQLTLLAGAGLTGLAALCYWPLAIPVARSGAALPSIVPPAEVRGALPLVGFWMIAAALVLPFYNVLFHDRFSMPVARVGTLFGAAHLLTAVLLVAAAELPRRWGPRRALTLWMCALAPALWALAVSGSLAVTTILFVLQGIVAPATNPLIDQLLLERVEKDRQGIVASWRNAAAEAAGAIGAAGGGLILQVTSFATLFLVAGAVAAVSAAALAINLGARPISAPLIPGPDAS